jgi:hypothetical protein
LPITAVVGGAVAWRLDHWLAYVVIVVALYGCLAHALRDWNAGQSEATKEPDAWPSAPSTQDE